jgi:hypothetical protein
MKKIINNVAIALLLVGSIITLGIWFFAPAPAPSNCVSVYVDYGVLSGTKPTEKCVLATGETNALSIVEKAGYQITGTTKYGTQIVCRVNNLPSAVNPIGIKGHESYVEPCADMPPEFGYWAFLINSKKSSLEPTTGWNWAPKGIVQMYVKPGEKIALVFSDNGKTKFPG